MRIAVVAFDGFNEVDSFVALSMIGRVKRDDWNVAMVAPALSVRSAQGVRIDAQQPLEFANEADAVLIGSARSSREVVKDDSILSRIQLDPKRQLIGSQCSGALILAKLGLLPTRQACTDRFTRPLVEAAGIEVLEQSFMGHENVATAGGCLSAHYLATWVLWRLADKATAERALLNVVPVGEERAYIERALKTVEPFIGQGQ
jgi:transcriptional regulator GlxA family with amidase domain